MSRPQGKTPKQIFFGIAIWSRHSKTKCEHFGDRFWVKCNCTKHYEYMFEGKQYQPRVLPKTGSFTIAKERAQEKYEELERLRKGEPAPKQESGLLTVEDAVRDWLVWREAENTQDMQKSKRMANLFKAFCLKHKVAFLNQVTKQHLIDFKKTLPFRRHTSNSMKQHWGCIKGMFDWFMGQDNYLRANPMPTGPQFKDKVVEPEVIIPKPAEIQRILFSTEINVTPEEMKRIRLFMTTMRRTGMAIADTTLLDRNHLEESSGHWYVFGKRQKMKTRAKGNFRVEISPQLAQQLQDLPNPGNPDYFFLHGSMEWKGSRHIWGEYLREVFKTAKIKMTPHGFRHFFISEQLEMGTSSRDVAHMVGATEAMIEKRYSHSMQIGLERVAAERRERFLKLGLNEHGDPLPKEETVN